MAGKIVADTLEHSTAGSVTTDFVVDGTPIMKAFFNQSSASQLGVSANSLGSYNMNVSSASDDGTGIFTITLTSSLSTLNSVVPSGMTFHSNNLLTFDDNDSSSSEIAFECHDADSSGLNDVGDFVQSWGDLA